ncbi:hypothetical protein BGZ60DRAFT_214327 [Tricladium varicosporioides]|nr:hypothetical protein BGZ60DRAFT_214327 [Hymenoscyphus varicosporioides]
MRSPVTVSSKWMKVSSSPHGIFTRSSRWFLGTLDISRHDSRIVETSQGWTKHPFRVSQGSFCEKKAFGDSWVCELPWVIAAVHVNQCSFSAVSHRHLTILVSFLFFFSIQKGKARRHTATKAISGRKLWDKFLEATCKPASFDVHLRIPRLRYVLPMLDNTYQSQVHKCSKTLKRLDRTRERMFCRNLFNLAWFLILEFHNFYLLTINSSLSSQDYLPEGRS